MEKYIKLFTVAIVALLIGWLMVLGYKKHVENLVFSNDSPHVIVQSIYTYLTDNGNQPSKPDKGSLWWVSDDKWNIIDSSAYSTTTYIKQPSNNHCMGPGPDYLTPNQRKSCSKLPEIIKLNQALTNIFLANGFKKSDLNSSKSLDDPSLYDYQIAFQKNETRCILITNAEGGSNEHISDAAYTVSCSDNFLKFYQEQLPYLKALVAYNSGFKDAVVDLPPFASEGGIQNVGTHFRRTGQSAIIKKVGENNYKVLFLTQEQPNKEQCAILRENDAPQSYLQTCNSL